MFFVFGWGVLGGEECGFRLVEGGVLGFLGRIERFFSLDIGDFNRNMFLWLFWEVR